MSTSLIYQNRAFRTLWAAGSVTELGSWLSYVATSVLVVSESGSALSLALVLVFYVAPRLFISPLGGWLSDRFEPRSLLVWGAYLEAVVTAGMVWAAMVSSAHALLAALLLRTTVAALTDPARGTLLPHVVPKHQLSDANALLALSWGTIYTLGVALGGVLTLLGPVLALVLDAATFVVAGALFARLPNADRTPRAHGIARVAAGRQVPRYWRLLVAKAPIAFVGGLAWVVLNVDTDARWPGGLVLGLVMAARGLGTSVGPLLLPMRRLARIPRWCFDALSLVGALAVLFAANLSALACAAFVWGIGTGANWVWTTTAIQLDGERDIIGWLTGVDSATHTLAMSLGAIIAGAGLDRGVSAVELAAVILLAGAAWGALHMTWPQHMTRPQRVEGDTSTAL